MIHICKSREEYINSITCAISESIRKNTSVGNTFSLVLSGGTTPKDIYAALAKEALIPWNKVHVFLADERYVQLGDPQSNFLMIKQTLFDKIDIPKKNTHRVPTHFKDPHDAAVAYEKEIKTYFSGNDPQFDLIVLGIGEDCHTASLFPGSILLKEQTRLAGVETNSPKPPALRITLTFPALNNSKKVYFLATGDTKAEAVKQILEGGGQIDNCPAKGVKKAEWWLDESAARLLLV